jgi:predicted enzyme related to lactoylglutathione lyase
MERESIDFLSGILLVSPSPEPLAAFYRDVLGVPLEAEAHGDTLPHWGCDLGDVHFAIHPIEDFPDRRAGVGAVKLAFNVFDLHALVDRLQAAGVALFHPPKDTGFFWSAAIQDPDGNFVELTQMSDAWFSYLQHRRAQGGDVVARWQSRKSEAR